MGYKQFSYVAAMTKGSASVGPPADLGDIALFTTSIFHQTSHFASLTLTGSSMSCPSWIIR